MNYGKYTLEELKKGYHFSQEVNSYICNHCGKTFGNGQVFSINNIFYIPEAAAVKHIELEHGGNFHQLLHTETKYNTFTEKQKELLSLFNSNTPDSEIAKILGVTTSTVRHQKFTFREKAKQARFYLAVFEQAFENSSKNEETIVPIHDHAVYYDERYVTTEQEKRKILETSFLNMNPLRLKAFPSKEKKKVVVLTEIAEQFEYGKNYTEKEVNQILKLIYNDYITLRRYLIMYGFMERNNDGSGYWLT